MHTIPDYALTWIVINGSTAVSYGLIILATAAYILLRPGMRFRKTLVTLGILSIAFKIAIATYLTVEQHTAWAGSEIGRLFLPPHQSWAYFAGYTFERFWMELVLALILGGVWYGFLRLLRAKSERYFDTGEIELSALLVFAIGWPNALIMVPLAGVALILVSIVRLAVFKRQYTTLGIPFMIAALITFTYGGLLRSLLRG